MNVTTEKQLAIRFKYGFDHQELVDGKYSADQEMPWHIDYMNLDSTLTLYFLQVDDSEVFVYQLNAPGKNPISFVGMNYNSETKAWLSPREEGGPDSDEILRKCATYFEIPEFAFYALLEVAVHRCVEEVDLYVSRGEAMTLYLDEEIEYGRFPDSEDLKEQLSRALCIWTMPYENTIKVEQAQDGLVKAEELYEGNERDEGIGLYVLTV